MKWEIVKTQKRTHECLEHRHTLSVPVLILHIFVCFFYETETFPVNFYFESREHSMQTTIDKNKIISYIL